LDNGFTRGYPNGRHHAKGSWEKQSLYSESLFDPHDGENDVDLVLDRIQRRRCRCDTKPFAIERNVAAYDDLVLALFDRDRNGKVLRHPVRGQVSLHSVGIRLAPVMAVETLV
jgi:hypothetical protein